MAPKRKDSKEKKSVSKEAAAEGKGPGNKSAASDNKKGGKAGAPKKEQLELAGGVVDHLMDNVEEHIQDGDLYPRYVAHAVCVTVAQMVNMLCVLHVNRMENWNSVCEGSVPSEWECDPEPALPEIDSWARSAIPLLAEGCDGEEYSTLVACNNPVMKPERRGTVGQDSGWGKLFQPGTDALPKPRASSTGGLDVEQPRGQL